MDLISAEGLPFAIYYDDVLKQAVLSYRHDMYRQSKVYGCK